MYSIIVIRIPVSDVNSVSIIDSRICNEVTAKNYKEFLPSKVGSTLTVRTFPTDWDMILTTVTRIS